MNTISRRANIFVEDLNQIVDSFPDYSFLDASNILISGGTGFIGKWLISSLLEIIEVNHIKCQIYLLTRNPEKAATDLKPKKEDSLKIIKHDFLYNEIPGQLKFQHFKIFINGATTSTGTPLGVEYPIGQASRNSTDQMLQLAISQNEIPTFINLSSGIVKKEFKINDSSNRNDASENRRLVYREAKKYAEDQVSVYSSEGLIKGVNPRLFSFYGPHLPITGGYLIGDFLSHAIAGKSITVKGDPQSLRSFMYPTELVIRILQLIFNPKLVELEIGSAKIFSILEVARIIAELYKVDVKLAKANETTISYDYIPNTFNLNNEYGKLADSDFISSIQKWVKWINIQNI